MTTKTPAPAVTSTADETPRATGPAAGRTRTSKKPPKREAILYRYQLAQFITERGPDGWYFAKTWSLAAGERPMWLGPYDLPQDVCIAMARSLCAELSNRHHARTHPVKAALWRWGRMG